MANSDNKDAKGADFAAFEDRSHTYSRRGIERKSAPRGDLLQDTLELLYSEHRYIASLLDAIEEQEQRMRPGKIPDYNLLLDILDYLTHYPDLYHHPREDILFAQMLENDSQFQSKLDRLQREHKTLRYYNAELFNELTRIAAGRPIDQASLRQSIRRYLSGYRKHMDYESKEIFPSASGELNASDVKKLQARTLFKDDPLFGVEVQYKYRRLGRQVQARVGMASQQLLARELSDIESVIEKVTVFVDTLDKLSTAVGGQGRGAFKEQLAAIKQHTQWREGPNFLFLPLALARNHHRQVKEGVGEIRQILQGHKRTGNSTKSTPLKRGM